MRKFFETGGCFEISNFFLLLLAIIFGFSAHCLTLSRCFWAASRLSTQGYEMLSGHNRMNAGKLAGLESAWCLVKEGLTDEEALMYVIETNLLQRSFADLLPSEKAAVLALR